MGRVRTNNEDCYKIVEPLNLFVLSDGMGAKPTAKSPAPWLLKQS